MKKITCMKRRLGAKHQRLFFFFLILLGIGIQSANAQEAFSYKGTVVDESNEPLPGVSIIVAGTTVGTVTDMDGKFDLSYSEKEVSLTFSFIGFQPQTLSAKAGDILKVVLLEETEAIDEVVVVGGRLRCPKEKSGYRSDIQYESGGYCKYPGYQG